MIRNPEHEQLNRLTVKTLDQVFGARAREGLGCSLFEAEALTELVKEVYVAQLPAAAVAGVAQRAGQDLGTGLLGDVGQLLRVGGVEGVGMIH